ncbi:unnamed protein product [Angiostrongylus costaricensis]|uniref:40S ribosomal protein S6 n=1 Tax=Angiostrongylus costaricensis TaxID=334426 RepID=A0A0R3Q1I0_ANGCS|nr:unnamed protein product [Angiostrongylus costaricensis]
MMPFCTLNSPRKGGEEKTRKVYERKPIDKCRSLVFSGCKTYCRKTTGLIVRVFHKISGEKVDLNDYVMKAAESNTVVHPRLVKKGGNIDDAPHVPTKMKLRTVLDEAMKTREDTEERDDKNAFKIKWGDAKCVVYETRDQLTLEDEAEEAVDLI